ncbi:MAG: helix-turn-helix domain containing protein [Candidatus Nanopelagicales bacterium]|nr:helix-turn-helix domain containing protein [Candidatus Nanopelagicales bacterium]
MSVSSAGLRARKRQDTHARLEEAAVALVLRDGLEQTTIQAICERADVSPRTFFNYFDCKDSAILGMQQPALLDEHAQEFLRDVVHADAITAVLALLQSMFDLRSARPQIREDRLELIRRHPQLLVNQLAKVTQAHGQVAQAVQVLLRRDPRFAGHSDADLADLAEFTLGSCVVALRIATREVVAAPDDLDSDHIQQRAHWLVQQLVKEIDA